MLKKAISVILLFLIVFSFSTNLVSASEELTLVIDGKTIEADVNPMIIDGRTMVPVRVLFDSFGADVLWNENLRQVIISTKSTVIVFTIGSKTVYIDGVGRPIDVPPVIVQSRTLVPIRFISSVLGYDVLWNGSTRTVYITNKVSKLPDTTDKEDDIITDNPEKSVILSKINAVKKAKTMDITVSLSEKTEPKTMQLSSPDRLVFDFYNVEQTCANSNIKSDTTSVLEIRWAHHDDYTRLVVETAEKTTFTIRYTSSACIISVALTEYKPPEDDTDDHENKNDTVTDDITINGSAPVIVIDAGHGGYDSGAIGYDEDENIVLKEKDVNLTIAKHVFQRLKDAGIKVIMTRNSDVALGDTVMADLVARSEIANSSGADLFISIHNNAFTNPEATGTSVLYAGLSNNGDYGITSKDLAENILTPLVKATGLKDRGIVESPEMVVLKKTMMPAVLIECAFVSSYNDQLILSDPEKLSEIADGIYEGIIVSLFQMGKIE